MTAALSQFAIGLLRWSLRFLWFLVFVLVIIPLAWLAVVVFLYR